MRALSGLGRFAGQALGAHAEVAQVLQKLREDAERVGRRRDGLGEHQRRVERGDVHVQDRPRDAFLTDHGVAAADGTDRSGQGHRLAPREVLAKHERVDLGGRAAQRARLIVEGYRLRLREVRRRQDRPDRERLDRVVACVGHEPLGRLAELARDLRAFDIGPAFGGDAEVASQVLQAEPGQIPRARIVELGEDPRVDDVAARDLVAPVADRALRDLEARHPAPERFAAAPPGERDPVHAGAGLEILEVEPEDVVPLDHVRVALADDARALVEQRALVESVAAHDVTEAGRVGERDRDDPVAGPCRARKLVALAGHHLDVERQPAEVGEDEPAERGSPGLQEILMDRVAEEQIWRAGRVPDLAGLIATAGASAERLAPRPEARPPAQRAGALERIDREQSGRVLHEIAIDEQQERRERRGLGDGTLARAPVEPDRAPAVGQIEGDERRARVSSEEQGRVLDGEHALGGDLRNGDAAGVEIGEADERPPRRHGVRIRAGACPLNLDCALGYEYPACEASRYHSVSRSPHSGNENIVAWKKPSATSRSSGRPEVSMAPPSSRARAGRHAAVELARFGSLRRRGGPERDLERKSSRNRRRAGAPREGRGLVAALERLLQLGQHLFFTHPFGIQRQVHRAGRLALLQGLFVLRRRERTVVPKRNEQGRVAMRDRVEEHLDVLDGLQQGQK